MNYKYFYDNNGGKDDYGFSGYDNDGYGLFCKKYVVQFPAQSQDTRLVWNI